MKYLIHALVLAAFILNVAPCANGADSARLPNAFFAMDTSFHRPGLTEDQQLDLVKQLGFDGVCWTEQPLDKLSTSLAAVESRGLRMHAIYCHAKIAPDGKLETAPELPALMHSLKGHGVIIWLHLGGKGPAFDALTGAESAIVALRKLADMAAADELRIAIYPHIGEWTARFGDATKLAKIVNHKSFGVDFNLCHCLAVGDEANIPTLLENAGPLLFTATINGADAGITGGHWDKLIQPLGQGSFDTKIVLRKLKEMKFDGPIGFQGYGIKQDARSILVPTIAAWRKMSTEVAEGPN